MKRKFSDEDLRELLAYIASDPAFPFPELPPKEREKLIKDVIEEMSYLERENISKGLKPKLIINLSKRSTLEYPKFEK